MSVIFILVELRSSHSAERALQHLSTPFWLSHSPLQIHSLSSQAVPGAGASAYGYSSELLPAAPCASLTPAWCPFHCMTMKIESECHLFTMITAWNSIMGRVISQRNSTTHGKQASIRDVNQQVWWTLNVPSMCLREETFSFARCVFVATTQRACAKDIGDHWEHWRTCEGRNANFILEPPPFGISVCWFHLAYLQNESCHLDTNQEINYCSCYCSGGTIY